MEFWSGESITYGCIDSTEGVDASDSPTVTFECRAETATSNGTYQTPNVTKGENWPICKMRTTTIKTREFIGDFYFRAKLRKSISDERH